MKAKSNRTNIVDTGTNKSITRKQLIDLLNEDLAREYQAVIAYVNYSQGFKDAENVAIDLATAPGIDVPDVS